MSGLRPPLRPTVANQLLARMLLRTAARFMPEESTTSEELIALDPELGAVITEDVAVPGPRGPIPVRLYRRDDAEPGAGFVWVHGGAWMFGTLDSPEAHAVAMSIAARGIAVASVDYRKARGRTRFPVLSDDVLAAWQWVHAHVDRWGTMQERLHLGGASAGANLATGVVRRLVAAGEQPPTTLVAAYPLLHFVLPPLPDDLVAALESTPPPFRFTPRMVSLLNLNWAGVRYHDDPVAFPALGPVDRMPPTFVMDAESDELRASSAAFAVTLRAAGVETSYETVPETFHGYLAQPGTPGAQDGLRRIVQWIDQH
ncbi:alpha/beta hydrolase [Microbacterium sp. Au-Mic1]|uniref:alpha/beta hydrolase n=1 Tax=Microbacterium sp. Au-Mic1 TaxID=2906457 RepID=UPI001E4DD082|nr:alpha/beta hydrolase fold domain-containing protein [Microbacterium sp. Au-Mic1]MCE4025140.1 alpha/beta hydrolase [Microbacterium sp. Au-Mic1]